MRVGELIPRPLLILVLVLAAVVGAAIVVRTYAMPKPSQPIAFPHKTHTKFLECQTCHKGVTEQAEATIPQVELCMTCHQAPVTDSPEAAKLKQYAQDGKAIPWVRLFRLANDTRFSHQVHVAKDIQCTTCHGDISRMEGFGRRGAGGPYGVKLMDFCMTCHRQQKVSTDCLVCHK